MDAWSLTACTSSAVWASLPIGAGPLDYLNAFNKLCTKDTRRLVAVHLRLSRCTFSRLAVEEGRTDNRRDRYYDLRLYNHNTRTAYRGERTLTVVRSFVQISSKVGDEWQPVMEILSSNEMAECFVHALYDVQSLRAPSALTRRTCRT
jgi:hypothetical protein